MQYPRYIRTELSYREITVRRETHQLSVIRVDYTTGPVLAFFEVALDGNPVQHPFETAHAAESYRQGFIDALNRKNPNAKS